MSNDQAINSKLVPCYSQFNASRLIAALRRFFEFRFRAQHANNMPAP